MLDKDYDPNGSNCQFKSEPSYISDTIHHIGVVQLLPYPHNSAPDTKGGTKLIFKNWQQPEADLNQAGRKQDA